MCATFKACVFFLHLHSAPNPSYDNLLRCYSGFNSGLNLTEDDLEDLYDQFDSLGLFSVKQLVRSQHAQSEEALLRVGVTAAQAELLCRQVKIERAKLRSPLVAATKKDEGGMCSLGFLCF